MVSLDDAHAMAASMPDAVEKVSWGNRGWTVGGKLFAWERPLTKADIKRFGDETPPQGPIFATRVEDLGEKEAVLASDPDAFFTTQHFDGYAAVLVRLDAVDERTLHDAIEDGWLAMAPRRLVEQYLAEPS